MAEKLDTSMSRLDLAKMAVESISKGLHKRLAEHVSNQALHNMGLGFANQDQFLLLSTTRQYDNVASCGAGGRLLVGHYEESHAAFDSQLKRLSPHEDDGTGLNVALSAGLALLSSFRFKHRSTENFGMGRLPSSAMLVPSGGASASYALQPACLILLTDGDSLRNGNTLELSFGNTPLREFYQEPFRWDQRIFCLGVGKDFISSTQFLHPSLRALCEVTGGCHAMLRSTSTLSQLTDQLLKFIAPPRPSVLPIPDPTKLPGMTPVAPNITAPILLPPGTFVQGGPICCFQALEAGSHGEASPTHRSMLLYVPVASPVQPPTWCLPESFFPSKKLDTLPPRLAQPLLTFSRQNYAMVGSSMFDPVSVLKTLYKLDQLAVGNKKPLMPRDVYICEWVSQDGRPMPPPRGGRGEHYPVAVRGAGRSLSDGDEPMLNIGILHLPASNTPKSYCTLTLLPPEPHLLLPLLVKAADAEHRILKKYPDKPRAVHLDDAWRSELRAYLFRIPPYYHNALKRCLRPILPTSVHTLLSTDGIEALASQCFSKQCLQKIRTGELQQKDQNERLERQEQELRRRREPGQEPGLHDTRASSYLAALRMMPPPWKMGRKKQQQGTNNETVSDAGNAQKTEKAATDILGDLPSECLVAYYESRRRWIFGGSGLTTRNVMVDGVCNEGSNSQRCSAKPKKGEESLLAASGVGVSTLNEITTVKMGDYRERLLWTRAPIVGYGSNDCTGVAGTTAADGSPVWSVDDNAMPISFFDPKTGEFADSVQTRVRSRLTVHFGNPFKDKRGDTLIPEAFQNQRPPRKGVEVESVSGPTTPPGSPPRESFMEGEGEALFASSPGRKSPVHSSFPPPSPPHKKRDSPDNNVVEPDGKRLKKDAMTEGGGAKGSLDKRPAAPELPKPPPSARPPPPPTLSGSPRPPGPPKVIPSAPPVPPISKQPKTGTPPPPKPKPPIPGPPAVPPGNKPKPPKRPTVSAPPKPPKPPGGKEGPSKASSQPTPAVEGSTKISTAPAGTPAALSSTQKPPAPPKKVVQQAQVYAVPSSVPPAQAAVAQVSAAPIAAAPPQVNVEREDKKPEVDLPPGWMCVWSKSQKRWYFFDTKSNKSVWQWPPP